MSSTKGSDNNRYHLWSISVLQHITVSHLILTTDLQNGHYYLHFMVEVTETEGGKLIYGSSDV